MQKAKSKVQSQKSKGQGSKSKAKSQSNSKVKGKANIVVACLIAKLRPEPTDAVGEFIGEFIGGFIGGFISPLYHLTLPCIQTARKSQIAICVAFLSCALLAFAEKRKQLVPLTVSPEFADC